MNTPDKSNAISVSALNRRARMTLEQEFNVVWVVGELSNFARPRSGHWYFTLKDEQAQVRCAMFANRNRGVQMQPSDGQLVLLRGRISLYEGRGDFQVIADHMQPAGEGALRQAFEQLKVKLENEGLFSSERKLALPEVPSTVAIVTSSSGAALRDILAVWRRRFPLVRTIIVPTQVQGEQAEQQVIAAIERATTLQPDVILLSRGGGSLEDLWTFNLESVARAIVACPIPVVTGIGHEIDLTIADLVADLRAPTPSAAAELVVPERGEIEQTIRQYRRYLRNKWQQQLELSQLHLRNLVLRLGQPDHAVQQAAQRVDDVQQRLMIAMTNNFRLTSQQVDHLGRRIISSGPTKRVQHAQLNLRLLTGRLSTVNRRNVEQKQLRLQTLTRVLHSVSPLPTMARGYAIVRNQAGDVVADIKAISKQQVITTFVQDGSLTSKVIEVHPGQTLQSQSLPTTGHTSD